MTELACFDTIAAELLRTSTTAGALVLATLDAVPVNRARAGARHTMRLSMPWVTVHDLRIVNDRGYPIEWDFRAVQVWFAKCLPGNACALQLSIPDAASIANPWTDQRAAAQAARVAAINTDEVRLQALAKEATAAEWGDKPRRAAVQAAARAMREAAAIADTIAGGLWPDPQ